MLFKSILLGDLGKTLRILLLTLLGSGLEFAFLALVRHLLESLGDGELSWQFIPAINPADTYSLMAWCGAVLILVALRFWVVAQRQEQVVKVSSLFELKARQAALNKLERKDIQPQKWAHESWNQDLRIIANGVQGVYTWAQAIVQLLIFLPVLFYWSWSMTLILLGFMLPLISWVQKKIYSWGRPMQELLQEREIHHRHFGDFYEIKQKSTESTAVTRAAQHFDEQSEGLFQKTRHVLGRQAWLAASSEWISTSATVVVLAVAAFLMQSGVMSGSQLLAYATALLVSYRPVKEAIRMRAQILDAEVAWQRFNTITKSLPEYRQVAPGQSYISWQNLSCGYEDSLIFESLNFQLIRSNPWVLYGPNGVGKSTLLKALAGLLAPHQGSISLDCSPDQVAYLDQFPIISPVNFSLDLDLERHQTNIPASILEALDAQALQVKLQKHSQDLICRELSGGEVQKLALLQVLSSPFEWLLLDEPLSGVDRPLRLFVLEELRQWLAQESKGLLVVSHEVLEEYHPLELENIHVDL